ncbi:hypothetical protein [Maridesulfovibrio salexigens]|uniref:Uncharacterized protein n=1 Tax=Maridesulfovibrio salexigens (strain ATCC 14822 / DSM 2638 / NCIMB 8403 / VKM B-1763) TaxID=526222 RepID=C6BW04_MARSD|nr:hypothetical protein [Maridesulfovibrio salexigens]ACS80207.1 hypothetical protein Desal_2148 [Maridesulfovibrio salexigens DSM 2638]
MSEESKDTFSKYTKLSDYQFREACDIASKYAGSDNAQPNQIPLLILNVLAMIAPDRDPKDIFDDNFNMPIEVDIVEKALAITKSYANSANAQPTQVMILLDDLTHLFTTGQVPPKKRR